eukprot:111507_1
MATRPTLDIIDEFEMSEGSIKPSKRGQCFKFKILIEILGTIIILTSLSMIGVIHVQYIKKTISNGPITPTQFYTRQIKRGNDMTVAQLQASQTSENVVTAGPWDEWFNETETKVVIKICPVEHYLSFDDHMNWLRAQPDEDDADKCIVCRQVISRANRTKHYITGL